MAKLNPTNMKLEFREFSDATISCEVDGWRYHVWLNRDSLEPRDRIMFENPPLDARSLIGDRRVHTRQLSLDRGAGAQLWPLMQAAIPTQITEARAALDAELAARRRKGEERRARDLAREAGPELLAALELLYDTGADSASYPYARSKAAAAIAKAKPCVHGAAPSSCARCATVA